MTLAREGKPVEAESQAADLQAVRTMIETFLEALMVGRYDTVAHCVDEACEFVFTGGRRFDSAADITRFNKRRYKWVRKRIERTDVGRTETGAVVVYSIGALYGEWPDGAPFDDNRYIDRFEIANGRIVRWEVWNDSAEHLLLQHGHDC